MQSERGPSSVGQSDTGLVERIMYAWCALATGMIFWGYGLASCDRLASKAGWEIGALLCFASSGLFLRLCLRDFKSVRRVFGEIAHHRGLLAIWCGVAAVAVLGALTALVSAPSNWDSLTYHLARVGYYLENGNLSDFGANFYAQEQQARGAAIIQSGVTVLCGRSDRLSGLPQFLAYLVCLVAVFGICRDIVGHRTALAGAGIFGLLTNVSLQAPTAQNDLLLTSFLGAGLIGACSYLRASSTPPLFLAAIGFALAVSVKASALTIVPAAFVSLVLSSRALGFDGRETLRKMFALTMASGLAVCVFAFPAGYWKNIRRYGNPIGNADMFERTVGTAINGSSRGKLALLNTVRFASDMCTLNGIPERLGGGMGETLRTQIGAVLVKLGIDAESAFGTRAPFTWRRARRADEDLSYYGWLGPGLLLPGIVLAIFRAKRNPLVVAWAAGFLVFFATQVVIGPYDPWRGRFFIYVAIFALPATCALLDSPRRLANLAWTSAMFGALAAVAGVLWRAPHPIAPHAMPSIFRLTRLEQMALYHPSFPALVNFDRIVPPHATVVCALPGNEFEYALFGSRFSRRIIPIAQWRATLPDARKADYLLYDRSLGIRSAEDDIDLGHNWSLRQFRSGESFSDKLTE